MRLQDRDRRFWGGLRRTEIAPGLRPDIIKIVMDLIRNVETNRARQANARSMVSLCKDREIEVFAEGIESPTPKDFLRDNGTRLMQGYLFCPKCILFSSAGAGSAVRRLATCCLEHFCCRPVVAAVRCLV